MEIAYKTEETLQDIGLKLVSYYENCSESILQAEIVNDETIKKCVTTCVKLFESLRICDHLLRRRNIKHEEFKEALLKMLKDKFYEYC